MRETSWGVASLDADVPRNESSTAATRGFPQSVTTTSDHNGFSVTAPHYRFPPIDVSRKFFEDAVGLKGYDWGEALEATTS